MLSPFSRTTDGLDEVIRAAFWSYSLKEFVKVRNVHIVIVEKYERRVSYAKSL